MPKDIEDKIKEELLPANSEKNIADKLQEINDLFLTKYKLKVDDIEIIPLETEIYYHNEQQKNIFKDQMIHKNELQKSRFGKLYFHRYQKNGQINHRDGGVDICLSDGEYYLSILLRTVIFDKDGIISGPNKIQEKFYYDILENRILSLEGEIKEKVQEKQANKDNNKILIKRTNNINADNIYHQKRIRGEDYKKGETYNLNSLNLGDTKFEYLNKMIESKQCFYLKHGEEIKKKFKEGNYGK